MLILSGPGEGGGAAQPVIGRARAAQPSSGAAHEPVRLAADGIVVIGNADPVELGKLFEVAADARSALAALVPGTASRVFPLTVFIDCGEQSPGPGIHEQKWGLHVVLRCRASLDGRDGIELHARLLLQQAVRSLPLWLEVGSARLAARVERARDGGLLIGQPAVDDLAGY